MRKAVDTGQRIGRALNTHRRGLQAVVSYNARLWPVCFRRLRQHNVLAMSSALSFRTLFAMIPLLVLTFVMAESIGVVDSEVWLRNLLDDAGLGQIRIRVREVPEMGPWWGEPPRPEQAQPPTPAPLPDEPGELTEYEVSLSRLIERQVGRLRETLTIGTIGPVGVALMIWTALTLLTTMERSLNRIFGAVHGRGFWQTVLVYWSVVTLGPILLAAVTWVADRLVEQAAAVPTLARLIAALGWLGTVAVGIALLGALYKLMPNTFVSLRSALAGAVVAVPLWLLARWGFSLYISEVVARGNIYAVLGLLPLFLLWMNLSWWIFLFGGELAHATGNLRAIEREERRDNDHLAMPLDVLGTALAVTHAYLTGGGPIGAAQVADQLGVGEPQADWLLERLVRAGILATVQEPGRQTPDRYLPSKPAESIRVLDVLELAWSQDQPDGYARYGQPLAGLMQGVHDRLQAGLDNATLADVVPH